VLNLHVDDFVSIWLVQTRGADARLANPPIVEHIAEDPALRDTKIIAEAWMRADATRSARPSIAGPNGTDSSATMCAGLAAREGFLGRLATRLPAVRSLDRDGQTPPRALIHHLPRRVHPGDLVASRRNNNLATRNKRRREQHWSSTMAAWLKASPRTEAIRRAK
jgi:glycogen operon protein